MGDLRGLCYVDIKSSNHSRGWKDWEMLDGSGRLPGVGVWLSQAGNG